MDSLVFLKIIGCFEFFYNPEWDVMSKIFHWLILKGLAGMVSGKNCN
jgi:hypothetical protein